MQATKIKIAKKTLKLLENSSWEKITLLKVLEKQKDKSIKNKNDLLININRYFDFILKQNLVKLEKSTAKDMLFEVLMARLDILNQYRGSIKNLLKYFSSNPHKFVKLLPSFGDSIILISSLSNIDVSGVKGIAKIKAIFLLYVIIIYTWNKDETESLEKTMTTLDKYLNNLEKIFKLI